MSVPTKRGSGRVGGKISRLVFWLGILNRHSHLIAGLNTVSQVRGALIVTRTGRSRQLSHVTDCRAVPASKLSCLFCYPAQKLTGVGLRYLKDADLEKIGIE